MKLYKGNQTKTPSRWAIKDIVELHLNKINSDKQFMKALEEYTESNVGFPKYVDNDIQILKILLPEIADWVEYRLYECG
jgi:hypothetical protein